MLGVLWDLKKDQFYPDLSNFDNLILPKVMTKTSVLSLLSSIWDPLGSLAPITLSLRLIFQALCKTKIGWKEPIAPEYVTSVTD